MRLQYPSRLRLKRSHTRRPGGTGAAPLIFTDSVSLPFQLGFSRVYRTFAERGLQEQVVFLGGGKLGLPDNAVVAFALGCDMVNVAREAMLAIGCIQAQKCHTDHCPTGVATQKLRYTRGLDPTDKSVRVANYVRSLRRDLSKVANAVGVPHPALITTDDLDVLEGDRRRTGLGELYGYAPDGGRLGGDLATRLRDLMADDATRPTEVTPAG